MTFSLAALMAFYTGNRIEDNALIGNRNGEEYRIMDDAKVLEFFKEKSSLDAKEYTKAVLSNKDFWGRDLTLLPGVEEYVSKAVGDIRKNGMRKTMEAYFL